MPNVNLFLKLIFMCVILLVTITGCAKRGSVVIEDDRGRVIIESKGDESYPNEEQTYYPNSAAKIPKGHMPPPGKCRIWYPDLPPGHQPPPGNCDELKYDVPRDAWLIQG
jgi:hypothetical protein